MNDEQVKQYQDLMVEKSDLITEKNRIEAFLARPEDNLDNVRSINAGKIFVKFAGTACMLPTGIFTGALNQRKTEIDNRLTELQSEIDAL